MVGDVSLSRAEIAASLAKAWPATTFEITQLRPLSGGAIQENWYLDAKVDGQPQELVLRTNAPSQVPVSLSRAQEFSVLAIAHRAGVTVPEPLAIVEDVSVIGRPFYVMRRHAGTALGAKIVKDQTICPDRDALARRLGRELALIHAIRPPHVELDFMGDPEPKPARSMIMRLRSFLDDLGTPEPALEWGLRWCELHAPEPAAITLVHQDFRSGNLLLGQSELAAVLDWEFAGWGDPMSDLGWFCARCWRYSRPELEAGGLGSRDVLYQGYRAVSDIEIDDEAVRYWEVMAHLRWAVIALQQADRHLSGRQQSLELALTGCIVPELAHQILAMTPPERWSNT